MTLNNLDRSHLLESLWTLFQAIEAFEGAVGGQPGCSLEHAENLMGKAIAHIPSEDNEEVRSLSKNLKSLTLACHHEAYEEDPVPFIEELKSVTLQAAEVFLGDSVAQARAFWSSQKKSFEPYSLAHQVVDDLRHHGKWDPEEYL